MMNIHVFSCKRLHNISQDFWFDHACNNQNQSYCLSKNTGKHHPYGSDCPFVHDFLFRCRFENPHRFWSQVLSSHDSGVFWAEMVENPVLLDMQHLGRFLWLLFKSMLSSLEVAAIMVLCFTCKMAAVHFWLCFPDSITNLLRFAGFQIFRIASVV